MLRIRLDVAVLYLKIGQGFHDFHYNRIKTCHCGSSWASNSTETSIRGQNFLVGVNRGPDMKNEIQAPGVSRAFYVHVGLVSNIIMFF